MSKRMNLPLFTGTALSAEQLRKAADKQQSESSIQEQIIRLLQLRGFVVVRINGGGFKRGKFWFWSYIIQGLNTHDSFPDLLAMKGNETGVTFSGLLIECKNAKGKLTPGQELLGKFLAQFGIIVHVFNDTQSAYLFLKAL